MLLHQAIESRNLQLITRTAFYSPDVHICNMHQQQNLLQQQKCQLLSIKLTLTLPVVCNQQFTKLFNSGQEVNMLSLK